MKILTGAGSFGLIALSGLSILPGCSTDDGQKAWNSFTTCLAGPAAQAPLAARLAQLRLIQLASVSAGSPKDAWPARCEPSVNELYNALSNSGDTAVLRRKLHEKLGCSDGAATCKLANESTLLSTATELWEAASGAGLKTEAAAGVAAPPASPPPLLDAKSWLSFSDKPLKVVSPTLLPDGRALLLLKAAEGRARPTGCEFAAGFTKVHCLDGSGKMPELPAQSIELVPDAHGLFSAGLSEDGLFAFDLQSGERSEVRGSSKHLVRDGLAVDHGGQKDVKAQLSKAPDPKNLAPSKEEGFVAVQLTAGKAGKDVKLAITPQGEPLTFGDQIAFLSAAGDGVTFNAKDFSHGKLKDELSAKGNFSGPLHTCSKDSQFALAAYAGHAGQPSAKATGGEGKTQLTFTLFQGTGWSKPAESALPFDRSAESELVCSKSGASLAYVRAGEGGVQVGRLDCSADGCKPNEVKVPGLESKWWWLVAPLGDKVALMWRSSLGETRLRVAALADLPTAKDSLVFDSPDFGGPAAGDATALASDSGALLIFRDERPVALQIGPDGGAHVITR